MAKKLKIPLDPLPLERMQKSWAALPQHKVSMWQDLHAGKKTEVSAINGAIDKLGVSLGVPTPCNRMITSLVYMLEEKRGLKSL